MNDISTQLRDADPVPVESGLSADDVSAMRRAVLAAVETTSQRTIAWGRALAIATAIVLIAGGGAAMRRGPARVAVATTPPPVEAAASGQRTQLQFSTPGGTRIVWTIDPAFQLTEKR
jgi:hypothetical protein